MSADIIEERIPAQLIDKLNLREKSTKYSYQSHTQKINEKGGAIKLSYFQGETNESLSYDTIGQILINSADRNSRKIAISYYGGQKLTYKQVREQTETIAAALLVLGLKSGDHVGLWAFNSVEWYLSFLAIVQAGLVAVNLNPLYEEAELRSCLLKANVKALIMDEEFNNRNFYEILKNAVPEIENDSNKTKIRSQTIPLLQFVVILSENEYKGTYKWTDLFAIPTAERKRTIEELQTKINVHDTCNIQFTSGTTNAPKAVMLTHFGVVNNARFTGKYLNLDEKEHSVCLPVPFFHTLGTVGGLTTCVYFGVTLILPHAKFSPTRTLNCIIEERCTIVYGTPTMYIDILSILTRREIEEPQILTKMTSLKRFFSGGAICLPEVINKLRRYFPEVKFSSGYGMTEILSPFMSLPDDSETKILSSVGRIMDHQEVKVINVEGDTVPMGVSGELCCRGYSVTKGYYNDEEKTKASFLPDKWFHTGDRFIFLGDGYAQIIGRIKDTIIRGGENIEPTEIEQVLMTNPKIVHAQVYAVSCKRLGEVVAACIVKEKDTILDEDEVRNYCRGKIALYKIPEHVIFLSELPKTATGKIQKYKLREMTEEMKRTKK